MQRYFAKDINDKKIILSDDDWHHIKNVMRMKNNDCIQVVFNNTLPAYSAANANAVYCIVGDFNHGALANYPEGEGISIKYDDTTLMTEDLVRILGRKYVGVEAVADKSFCLIGKPASV